MGTMSAMSRSAKAPRKARSKKSRTNQSGTPQAEYRVGPRPAAEGISVQAGRERKSLGREKEAPVANA
jgi:hypothetical protein